MVCRPNPLSSMKVPIGVRWSSVPKCVVWLTQGLVLLRGSECSPLPSNAGLFYSRVTAAGRRSSPRPVTSRTSCTNSVVTHSVFDGKVYQVAILPSCLQPPPLGGGRQLPVDPQHRERHRVGQSFIQRVNLWVKFQSMFLSRGVSCGCEGFQSLFNECPVKKWITGLTTEFRQSVTKNENWMFVKNSTQGQQISHID